MSSYLLEQMFARRQRQIIVPAFCLLGALLGSTGCSSVAPSSEANLRAELAKSHDTIRRYEAKYGKLRMAGKLDFHVLQAKLRGRKMQEVAALLGRPQTVEYFGLNEAWKYRDIAFNSDANRSIGTVTIWFSKGAVEEVRASS